MSLLAIESADTPMHLATVEVFEPSEEGFDYARLVALVGDRLAFVPLPVARHEREPVTHEGDETGVVESFLRRLEDLHGGEVHRGVRGLDRQEAHVSRTQPLHGVTPSTDSPHGQPGTRAADMRF